MADSTNPTASKQLPTCILTGSDNWRLWALRTEANLRIHGAWDILRRQVLTEEEVIRAQRKHEIAVGIILSTLSDDILQSVSGFNDVRDLWELLEQKYGGTNKIRSIQGLRSIHQTLYSTCDSVETYITKIESGIREIKSQLSNDERFPEWFFVNLLLANLNEPKWDPFVTMVLNTDNLTFKDLAAKMIEQEKRMLFHEEMSDVALIKAKKGRQRQAAPSSCSHCGRKGHTKENCWDLYPDKKPEKYRSANKAANQVIFEDVVY